MSWACSLSCKIGEDMVHVWLTELTFQLFGGADGTYLTIHHNRNAVAILRFVHIVGSDKDGNAA